MNSGNLYNIRLQGGIIGVCTPPMKSIFLITLGGMGLLFSSCNTMIGLGRDMRMGGEGLENTANKASGGGSSSSSSADTSGAPVY
jgi:predicted small secreted protein